MIGNATYFAHTTYDRDNPDIKEGSTFADKDAFMLVMKQYAIKREFHTMVVHSDKSRYRAICADLECERKVYAKTSWLPYIHGIDVLFLDCIYVSFLFFAHISILFSDCKCMCYMHVFLIICP